jgi:serine/threonine protein kinase
MEKIGKGGGGIVYRALHTMMKTQVAIKFLNPTNEAVTPQAIEALRNEAHLLAQLNHPNVVRILDFEDAPSMPYVVMEYVDGQSALQLAKQLGRLPVHRSLSIVKQVASGLWAAQVVGILHRDVKPSNILVNSEWNAKIVDLGLAIKLDASANGSEKGRKGISGTAAYVAPEQILDLEPADHRADIYALGVSFYQLLTGKLPYTGSNLNEIFEQHLSAEPKIPSHMHSDIPPNVSNLVMQMMSLDVETRPQTYKELIKAIELIESGVKELVPA